MPQLGPNSYHTLPSASFPASWQLPLASSNPAAPSMGLQSSGQPPSYMQPNPVQAVLNPTAGPFQGIYPQGVPFMQQGLPGMQHPMEYYSPPNPYLQQMQMAHSMFLTQPRHHGPAEAAVAMSSQPQPQQAAPPPSQQQASSFTI